MISYYINNCDYLLNIKPKSFKFILFTTLIFFFFLIIAFQIEIDDTYISKAYIQCDNDCKLIMSLSISDIKLLKEYNKVMIENNKLEINKIDISEIKVDLKNKTNYQILTIFVDNNNNLSNKTIQDIKIFYNKERIIKKIFRILFM